MQEVFCGVPTGQVVANEFKGSTKKKVFTCYGREVRLMLKFLTTRFDTRGIRYVLVRNKFATHYSL